MNADSGVVRAGGGGGVEGVDEGKRGTYVKLSTIKVFLKRRRDLGVRVCGGGHQNKGQVT